MLPIDFVGLGPTGLNRRGDLAFLSIGQDWLLCSRFFCRRQITDHSQRNWRYCGGEHAAQETLGVGKRSIIDVYLTSQSSRRPHHEE